MSLKFTQTGNNRAPVAAIPEGIAFPRATARRMTTADSAYTVTIPGTRYVAHLARLEDARELAAALAKTATGRVGRRRIMAQPIITENTVEGVA